jgi:hypothetical protein
LEGYYFVEYMHVHTYMLYRYYVQAVYLLRIGRDNDSGRRGGVRWEGGVGGGIWDVGCGKYFMVL